MKGGRGGGGGGGQRVGLNAAERVELPGWSGREVRGMRGVAGKCIDSAQSCDWEGSEPAR